MFQNSVIRLQILVICHFKNAKLKTYTLLRIFFSNFEMRKSTNLSHSKISNCYPFANSVLLPHHFENAKIKFFTLLRERIFVFSNFEILEWETSTNLLPSQVRDYSWHFFPSVTFLKNVETYFKIFLQASCKSC